MKRFFSSLVGIGFSLWTAGSVQADHRDLDLFVAPELAEGGLMAFILPRFSLKTGVGVHVEPLSRAQKTPSGSVILQDANAGGKMALGGSGKDFALVQSDPDNPAASRFADWLLSEIGQRTINQFTLDGRQIYTGKAGAEPVVVSATLAGDAAKGQTLAYANCGRCHVIGERNRMKGIGSTPSFALLRSFDDWQDRFRAFYALNPHPSFSQVTGITDPFDKSLPPPISPLILSLEDLDDIVAFTNGIEPADLGAPLAHQ